MKSIRKIVVLGANGAMGAGSGAVFAAAGIPTTFLARTLEKAEAGRDRAIALGKGTIDAALIACGAYASDLGHALADADLVLEAVSEDLAVKRELFAVIDRLRIHETIVATVSSGLSIATICAERSASFRRNFLGIHLFNPPTIIRGCELIAHDGTDPGVVAVVRDFLANRCNREVIECSDTPAFAGNRVGFKVLNQVAQLAEEFGIAAMDQLVGTYTGRALAPLATIDLVGWDVHKAIVDNMYATTHDVCHAHFALPAYMQGLIAKGTLGRKSGGGFFKRDGKTQLALDLATGEYRPTVEQPTPVFVEGMKNAVRAGRHAAAMGILCSAEDREAALLREILLGYISYALGLVGEVVERPRDIDRIMGFGFAWAPPSVLVDAIGPTRTVALLEAAKLPVPLSIVQASEHRRAMFDEPSVDRARFFVAA
jgi:3-hydroxyacyl-CoA dehydrogenase